MQRIILFLKASETQAVLAVMALAAAATFLNGAYFPGPMTICVAGAWVVLLFILFAARGETLSGLPVTTMVPAALLACLWVWTGLSIFWSIAPDQTWIEFNRTGGYLAVFLIGLIAGRQPQARSAASTMFLAIATAAALYGLGAKAVPGVIDNLENLGRLSVPLGYTNAMGALMAIAYPFSLLFGADRQLPWFLRLASVMAGPLLLLSFFFTLSRGATLALVAGLAVYFVTVPLRLRSFGVMLLSLFPAVLIALWASDQDPLMKDRVDLALKAGASASLRWYLLAAVIGSGAFFLVSLAVGGRLHFSKRVRIAAGYAISAALVLALFTSSVLFASSKPSIVEWATDTYQEFRHGEPSESGAARLLEIGSSGRWMLWEEAMANWEDNPVAGTGGQTFPLVHLIRRESSMVYVKQPHSTAFGLLTELGAVGFILGTSFIIWVQALAARCLCAQTRRRDRALAGTMLTAMTIYLIHSAFDWDWNMFALTMIFFLLAGLTTGWGKTKTDERMSSDR